MAECLEWLHCTVIVTALLVIPFKVAVTVAVCPEAALELTVPLPLPWFMVSTAVFETVQLTWVVMSCCWLLPENVPIAVNVTVEPAATVVAEAVNVMEVKLPG